MKPPSSSQLSSLAARDVADFAASIRHRPDADPETSIVTRFDRHRGDWRMRVSHRHSPCSDPHHVVTPVSTPMVQPDRPRVEAVHIRPEGGKDESLDRYDAVFWTEAAVEKFILPYYASKCQWSAAHVLLKLTQRFYGYIPNPAADNRPEEVEEVDAGHEPYPFAIGHLPRSDYVDLEEGAGLAHDVWLLFRTRDGGVRHRALAEFL